MRDDADDRQRNRIRRQVRFAAGIEPDEPGAPGGGSLFSESILVFNEKPKLVELTAEYTVFDRDGTEVGTAVESGHHVLDKVARLLSPALASELRRRVEVRDADGALVLVLEKAAHFLRPEVSVSRPDGTPVGRIALRGRGLRPVFDIHTTEHRIGSVRDSSLRGDEISVLDLTGTEIAHITKTWEGVARVTFTRADHYVLRILRPLTDPLRTMVVATALCVDLALKTDTRTL
ncbi:phospholipid scramblase family protein [Kitasatospora sp. DSM 101779]|uniref:phospholipid scramblase family protein n=1 Tax=Kitasatospora sp. DSM 101779 TaxID=2853165 RepID=UPI0021DA3FC4|nr:phospholipid scramblase family protein [Kitasatospora sp. DSM 101779]MCU7820864.1 scramblase [Kitasatospora sp. DSM 101779]